MLDMKMAMQELIHKVEQSDIVCRKETEESKCSEPELRCKKAEEKCAELELEIQKKKIECELLNGQMKKLEAEKLAIEEELKVLMGKGYEPGQQVSCVKDVNKICSEEEKKGGIVNLIHENEVGDEVLQLMIENNVLVCEKKKAESEIKFWKDKFKKLEMWISKLDESLVLEGGDPVSFGRFKRGIASLEMSAQPRILRGVASSCYSLSKGIGDLQAAGTPSNSTPYNHTVTFDQPNKFCSLDSDFKYGSQARKQLNFEEENSSKKMAPSTPAVSRTAFHGVIDIIDSDDEPIIAKLPTPNNQKKSDVCVSAARALSGGGSMCCEEKIGDENNLEELHCDGKNVEDMEAFRDDFIFDSTPKRKRASNIITSDTESDDEDDVPICKLKRMHHQGTNPTQVSLKLNNCPAPASTSACEKAVVSATPARRRLMPLRKCYEKGSGKRNSSSQIIESKNCKSVPSNEDVEDELEDVGSELESEGESLDGFIVDNSDVGNSSQSEDLSNGSVEYDEIISKLGRRKKELKWEYEADMLAAFGKDPELCMKAVCALYRQQTSEEKVSKEALFSNKRGFSKFDAIKGSRLAEFLTNGDPQGDLNKSVKELHEYDPEAIDLCRKLATHYSKQLFEIYENKEDPFFLPA